MKQLRSFNSVFYARHYLVANLATTTPDDGIKVQVPLPKYKLFYAEKLKK